MRNPIWSAPVLAFAAQAAPGPISFNAPKSFPVPDGASDTASVVYTYSGRKQTTFTPTDKYMLLRFTDRVLKHDFYGRARIQVPAHEDLDLVDWAYNPSGVHTPAGYHGSSQVEPEDLGALEPSTTDAARTDANKQTETAQ